MGIEQVLTDIADATGSALPVPWAAAIGGVLGIVIGSYLATVFVRWPLGRSANRGRSCCDGCGRQLRWFEVVPLASWLFLRGRCRTCGSAIDRTHPAIEAICGLAGAAAFALGLPALAPMLWLLIVLAFFDAAYLWLPDRLVVPLAAASLLAPVQSPEVTMALRLAGGAIGFVVLWLLAAAFHHRTGRIGLGGGDPKLFGAIGLWCGALALPLVMLVACLIGFGDIAWRLLRGTDRGQLRLPLGTYLCLSTILLAMVWTQ